MPTDKLEALEREIREAPHPVRWCELEAWLKAWADRLAAIRAEMGGVTEGALHGSPPEPVAHPSAEWADQYASWYYGEPSRSALNPTTGDSK